MTKAPNVLEEIQSLQRETMRTGKKRCRFVEFYERLSPNEQAGIEAAMKDPSINGTTIARFFDRRGMSISGHSIQRHRRKDCTCDQ
jgi:hypothetical protein